MISAVDAEQAKMEHASRALGVLGGVLAEIIVKGGDTKFVDGKIADRTRDYRRAEKRLRRAAKRALAAE